MERDAVKTIGASVLLIAFMLLSSCAKEYSFEPELPADKTFTADVQLADQFVSMSGSNVDSSFALTGKMRSTGEDYLSITFNDDNSDMTLVVEIIPFSGESGDFDISTGYTDENTQIALFYKNGVENTPESDVYSSYFQTGDIANPVIRGSGTIKITSLTESEVKGTFEMTLINYDETGGLKEMKIDKGTFRVPVVKLDID